MNDIKTRTWVYQTDRLEFAPDAYPIIGLLGYRKPKNDPHHVLLYYGRRLIDGERLAYNLTFVGVGTDGTV